MTYINDKERVGYIDLTDAMNLSKECQHTKNKVDIDVHYDRYADKLRVFIGDHMLLESHKDDIVRLLNRHMPQDTTGLLRITLGLMSDAPHVSYHFRNLGAVSNVKQHVFAGLLKVMSRLQPN
ncbi:hypothetical protein EDM53_05450 [Rickettsiales endosymbiont of Peranema trichophorum]|uniref:hypothetical protein n=1 Tax=Rickettsiales endosymbiont of Peranema trichophorum TaxID=2486577 RepID=UPI001022ACC0|nr:hypothetical protein [Rickettsiales endosymbiont of Peranema trichophorum]RZI45316.1 hypothetical protein EDM53_05450 [Rickettsiales endosymbiont of Peranema trichophorum]